MNTYPIDSIVHFRDFNLRHPSQAMRVISHIGDTVKVLHTNGTTGEWLSRDLIDPETEQTNAPPRVGVKRAQVKNDCLGLSWDDIERAQGRGFSFHPLHQ